MGATHLLGRRLGKSEMPDFSKRYKFGHGAYRLFNRDVRVDAVQSIDINDFCSQSPKTRIDCLVDVSRCSVSSYNVTTRVADKSELSCQHHLAPALLDRSSHKFFVLSRAVAVSCVQKITPQIKGTKYRRRRFVWICRSIGIRQPKTAKSYGADLWSIRTQLATFHLDTPVLSCLHHR